MNEPDAQAVSTASLGSLLRGEVEAWRPWTLDGDLGHMTRDAALIVAGAGAFAAVAGSWRDPQQALYAGLKLPLIILLTALGNALLNALLAPLLGARMPPRQTFPAILASLAVASVMLGAFSPLAWFILWNAPLQITAGLLLSAFICLPSLYIFG